ncbi:unnamed protein product [Cuscuta europaea]|uniref:Non-structural maintenance of chromosomes element 1 homolog n=1 Tax=Cuscuta europaea TaxID=41803 RepID=A0A9P0YFR9_CUSEU|nr:unnamed protein product [Cuscuta europaea]
MPALSWRHHTLIQSLLSRGPLPEADFKSIFYTVTEKSPGTHNQLFNDFLRKINAELAYVQFELRACRNQYDGSVYYGVVNNVSDEQSKLGTKYSTPQIAFYKAMVEAIVQDGAEGCISKIQAINIRLENQDLASGKMIGSAKEDGLYIFDGETQSNKRGPRNACFQTVSFSNNKDLYLLHYKLGHPSFYYLKRMFPQLFLNKDASLFNCDMCALAKHHRNTYLPQSYKLTSPFTLVHSDIWGPSRIPTLKGKRWFVTIIDDHTRVTWVFLIKEKSEVEKIFREFYAMVQTQFHFHLPQCRKGSHLRWGKGGSDVRSLTPVLKHRETVSG